VAGEDFLVALAALRLALPRAALLKLDLSLPADGEASALKRQTEPVDAGEQRAGGNLLGGHGRSFGSGRSASSAARMYSM
jgi:hypothetical protein